MSPQAPKKENAKAEALTNTARAGVKGQDDATIMADTPQALTPAAIQDLQNRDKLVEVDRKSISPQALLSDPAFQEKDASGNELPVYIMPGVGTQKQTAIVVDIGNGKRAVIANEGIHTWDAAYVEQHLNQGNAQVAANKEFTAADTYIPADRQQKERYQELTKHIADTAQQNGMGDTRVIVSTEPGVTDAYGFKSKEGVNYVVIPKSELDNVLSDTDRTKKLEQVIDAQMPGIKTANNSPQMAVDTHRGDHYIAGGTDRDGKLLLTADPQLTQANIDGLVNKGSFIPVKMSDIVPQEREAIEQALKSGGQTLSPDTPVYLVAGANSDYKGDPLALMRITTDGNKPYIIIDQRSHQQNEAYVKDHVLPTELDMARAEADGAFSRLDPAVAKKLHLPADAQVLVNNDATGNNAVSFQTKEGKNYILLPREDVDAAAKPQASVQELQHAVDLQTDAIHKGKTSVDALLKGDTADKWMAEHAAPQNGKPVMPDQATDIDNATLDNLAKTGRVVEMKKENLTPQAAVALAAAKDTDGKPLPPDTPVYLVPNVNADGQDPAAGQVMHTKEGKAFILVNEQAHRLTKDDLQPWHDANVKADITTPSHFKGLSRPDDVINEAISGASPEEAAQIRRRYAELTHTVDQDGKNMKISKEVLLIDNSKEGNLPYASTGASSTTSKEGTNYIFMTRDELKNAISSDEGLAQERRVMGHETAHNAHRDTAIEKSLGTDRMADSRMHEMRADLAGEGPLGDGHPLARAKDYEGYLLAKYNSDNPDQQKTKLTDKEMQEVSQKLVDANADPQHPSLWEGIVALRHQDQLMKEYEAKYKKEHGHAISDETPAVQKRIRAAESQQVEDQTVEFMKDKMQQRNPTPTILNAPPHEAPAEKNQPANKEQEHKEPAEQQPTPDGSTPPASKQPAPPNKAHAGIEEARALFRKHSQQGAHEVDSGAAGFSPAAVAAQPQEQQRGVAT